MSYLDDEDLDEGDVPPLLGVEAIDLNAPAPKAAPPPPPLSASMPAAPAPPQKSRAPEEQSGLKRAS